MTIHASHIREETHGMVLGLERNGEKDLNPSAGKILEEGDILWIVGDMKLIQKFTQEVSDKNPKSA